MVRQLEAFFERACRDATVEVVNLFRFSLGHFLASDDQLTVTGLDSQVGFGEPGDSDRDTVRIIANLFEVDVDCAGLVEAALAGAEQYLVATDSSQLSADMDQLSEITGRATFLCLDLIPPFVDGYDFSQHDEYLGRAVDYVRFDSALAPVAWHLLGRTIVVRDLTAALKLSRLAPSGHRYVTINLHTFGGIT